MDILLVGKSVLPCLKQEQTAMFNVQRAFAACGKHSGEGERCSGRYRKVFGFVTGMAFTFAPESRSPSGRNAVRLPTGIAFGIDRIYHWWRDPFRV